MILYDEVYLGFKFGIMVLDVDDKMCSQSRLSFMCVSVFVCVWETFIVTLGRREYMCAFCASSMERRHWLSQTGSKSSPVSQSDTSIEELPGTPGLTLYLIPLLQCQPAPTATPEITLHALDLHRVFPPQNGLPLNLKHTSAPIMKPKCLISQHMMRASLWMCSYRTPSLEWWVCVMGVRGICGVSESQI